MVRSAFLILFLLPMLATSVQSAPARIALVIGNGEYEHAPLKNPVNDAALMVTTLKGAGFEVMAHVNLDRRELKRAFLRFGDRIKEAGKDTVSLVYYAGHGAQVNGENYLIPIGSLIEDERDVDIEGIRASSLLRTLGDANAALNIVILDACRNNPFKTSSRSAHQGLAKMDAPTGTLLAYSTAPGQVAEDGVGSNSAYTKALSLAIRRPGATVEQVFKRVRIEVMSRTSDEQVPWESSSLTGDFYFSGGAPTSQASVATVPALQSAPQISMEAIFWQSIQDSEDAGAFKAYLEQFPNGSFAALARFKAKKYQETEVAVAVPRTTSGQHSIDALKGYKIWIRSDKGEIGRGYCQRLEDAGLIVECDPNETNDPMEDVMLKCATLPANAGEILQEFLGIDSLYLYDWREHEDYGAKSGGYCDEYDAITIDSFASKVASLGSIDKLRGYRIWVRGNGGENIERYCQRLTEAGLIVRCLPDDEHDPENDIVLACATLPSDTGEVLQEYLGISGYKIYDWREHEDYGASPGGYCNEFNAIDISTYD